MQARVYSEPNNAATRRSRNRDRLASNAPANYSLRVNSPPTISRRSSAATFATAIFLSSFLLFFIEPIAGKRLLPLLGGSAAVWAACLVFFQTALLLGYLVAHVLATRASQRQQVIAYLALLALSLAQLAAAIDPGLRANTTHPTASVLWLLTVIIGFPFVTLSATGPLLQHWYSRSLVAAAPAASADRPAQPYWLFAISNTGSLLALLIYPLLVEPRWSIREQAVAVVACFTALAGVLATITLRNRGLKAAARDSVPVISHATDPSTIALWIALPACGSMLLSAITNHLSQNVATIPLLWVIPLGVYLLSFVVSFGNERWHPRFIVSALALIGLGAAGYLTHKGVLYIPIVRAAAIFSISLFVICVGLHSELYRRRPPPEHLTGFYFHIAAGGALGAVLVGIVAPAVLSGTYELAFGFALAASLGLVTTWAAGWFARGAWFALASAMAALVVSQVSNDRVNALMRLRNFYGTLWITEANDASQKAVVRTLVHGVITHGRQVFREDLHAEPNTYYGRQSGIGLALDLCCGDRPRRVGVIGLGTGTLAAFGRRGDVFRFYDINPAVEGLARRYFRYITESPARIEVVPGDARLSLADEPAQGFDVIAVDAFSGDAIPVHLITQQAMVLYRRHLAPGGIVAFHVSNRYLNLPPVVEQIARGAGMRTAFVSNRDDAAKDVWTSDWVLVSSHEGFITRADITARSDSIRVPPGLRPWTDDYHSLLPVFRLTRKKSE